MALALALEFPAFSASAFRLDLLYCVQNNNVRTLELLLAGPINKDDQYKALIYACREGCTQAVALFLQGGADPDTTDVSENSLLYLAIKNGHCDVTRALCNAGASVNVRGAGGTTPLHFAAKTCQDECIEILLKFGCEINAKDSSGKTALILAVQNKKYSVINVLLDSGCDVNKQDREGRTALHYGSHTAVAVNSLLNYGADVNIRDSNGCTPLLMAATEGLVNIVHILCHVPGCDVNIPNISKGKTPLHILANKGHARSVRDLLMCGADVNLRDSDDKTPLWYAVSNAKRDVASILLTWSGLDTSCGVSTDQVTICCPVELAVVRNRDDILKLIILTGYDSGHLRASLNRWTDTDCTNNNHKSQWLDLALSVPSLRHICRKTVRHSLGRNLQEKLASLPLPVKLRKYLAFHELEDFDSNEWLA